MITLGDRTVTIARAHLIEPSVTRWYHCVTRCVRRAFLLGEGENDRSRGRLFREGKAAISREVAAIFERIGTTAETWQARTLDYGSRTIRPANGVRA